MLPTTYAPQALALLRIVGALIYAQHALQKLIAFPLPPVPGYTHWSLAGLAGLIEIISVPLLALGLFTRPTAFLNSGLMAVAYVMAHGNHGPYPIANGGDVAVLFCFIFLYLAVAGPGAWSLDERTRTPRTPPGHTTGSQEGRLTPSPRKWTPPHHHG